MSNEHGKVEVIIICILLLFPRIGTASGIVRRFVLAADANSGGPGRIPLMYAVSDAEQFADVMVNMGEVDAADDVLLRNPDLREFETALADLEERVRAAADSAGRTEVLLYYSGHADEDGLLLGEQRLSYTALQSMMDAIHADVRITVLDACASGAITRIKGGAAPPGLSGRRFLRHGGLCLSHLELGG